jgi:hypothetical protein
MRNDAVRRRFCSVSRILAVWFFAGNLAFAAGPSWVHAIRAGGNGSDAGNAVKTDQAGNQYIAGSFSSNAHFGSQTLSSQGRTDMFLAKYGSGGNLLWVVQAGGVSDDTAYNSIGWAGLVGACISSKHVGWLVWIACALTIMVSHVSFALNFKQQQYSDPSGDHLAAELLKAVEARNPTTDSSGTR